MSETAPLSFHAADLWPELLACSFFTMTLRDLRPKRQAAWVLELFLEGQMALSIGSDAPRTASPGLGVLYPPGTPYREAVAPGERCQSVAAFFRPEASSPLHRIPLQSPGYRWIDDSDRQLERELRWVLSGITGDQATRLKGMSAFLSVIAWLLTAEDDGATLHKPLPRRNTENLVTRAREHMTAHLHEPIGVADLARAAGMSDSGFAHAYRRLAGRSPIQDLRAARIEAVKGHLLRGGMTLAQIAEVTGFADAFHLSHAFRQLTGQSPRQFRQETAIPAPPKSSEQDR